MGGPLMKTFGARGSTVRADLADLEFVELEGLNPAEVAELFAVAIAKVDRVFYVDPMDRPPYWIEVVQPDGLIITYEVRLRWSARVIAGKVPTRARPKKAE